MLVVAETERTRPTSAIVGAVYDSMAGRPLAGVRVSIAGGAYRDTTDGVGRYRIESPIAGDLIVTFDHLRFAAFRLGSILRDGRLERGTIDTVNAWVPGPDFLLRSLCGTVVTADTMSLAVVGSVKAARGDTTIEVDLKWAGGGFVRRLPAGRVAVSERETVMSVSLDSAGRFVACGVPRDRPVTVTARRDRRTGEPATIPRWSPAIVELQLDRPLD